MGGRVVDCNGLENRHTGNRIGGSNPSPSATLRVCDASGGLRHTKCGAVSREGVPFIARQGEERAIFYMENFHVLRLSNPK